MEKMKKVLLSVLVAAPMVALAQPGIMSSEAAGYLERGKQMYESHNYVGAIDQLEHMKQLPADASMREQADYYIALSRFERGDEESLAALHRFIDQYPASSMAMEAQMKIGNYYFYRGQWESGKGECTGLVAVCRLKEQGVYFGRRRAAGGAREDGADRRPPR